MILPEIEVNVRPPLVKPPATKGRADLLAVIDDLTERLLEAIVQIDYEFSTKIDYEFSTKISKDVEASTLAINKERAEYGLPPIAPPR